jgi:hypothetical protein
VKAFRAWLGEHIGVDEEDELSLRDTHSPACPICPGGICFPNCVVLG